MVSSQDLNLKEKKLFKIPTISQKQSFPINFCEDFLRSSQDKVLLGKFILWK